MKAREALDALTSALATASAEDAAAALRVLRDGAGLLDEPKIVYEAPAGLVPERRPIWIACVEAIRLGSVGLDGQWDDAASWEPVFVGDWESVLASLIIARRWSDIRRAAEA